MMTLGMLQKRKTTTTQTRIETRFKSFFVEPRDLLRDSLKVLALISNNHHYYLLSNVVFILHVFCKSLVSRLLLLVYARSSCLQTENFWNMFSTPYFTKGSEQNIFRNIGSKIVFPLLSKAWSQEFSRTWKRSNYFASTKYERDQQW